VIEDGNSEPAIRWSRANLRLVVNIARTTTAKPGPAGPHRKRAIVGLLRAVEGFDHRMNTRFSTYAGYWIKQSIKRALVNTAKDHSHPGVHGGAVGQVAPGQRQAAGMSLGRPRTQ